MDEVKRFVGIDVAKATLDVFIGSTGAAFSVDVRRAKSGLELKSQRFRQKPHQRRGGDACCSEAIDE
jgi:hypothetical protein